MGFKEALIEKAVKDMIAKVDPKEIIGVLKDAVDKCIDEIKEHVEALRKDNDGDKIEDLKEVETRLACAAADFAEVAKLVKLAHEKAS
jgi:hypothetical protein